MTNSSRHPALSSLHDSPSVAEYLSALHVCCAYARDAAAQRRFNAAHGLFQSAITFFDRAQKLVTGEADIRLVGSVSPDAVPDSLLDSRVELDECAKCVYPDDLNFSNSHVSMAMTKNSRNSL